MYYLSFIDGDLKYGKWFCISNEQNSEFVLYVKLTSLTEMEKSLQSTFYSHCLKLACFCHGSSLFAPRSFSFYTSLNLLRSGVANRLSYNFHLLMQFELSVDDGGWMVRAQNIEKLSYCRGSILSSKLLNTCHLVVFSILMKKLCDCV